jgi:hypothetical protein
MNSDYKLHQVFLLADDETLSGVDTSIIKCVDANYQATNHIPRNLRLGGQRYFGWMLMRAGSIVDLWNELDNSELECIAPQTIEGRHAVVWDGGMF